MSDPGIIKLAKVLVNYSLELQAGEEFLIGTASLARELTLTVGAGFPEGGGENKSGLHWDMLCDMAESEITVDGELFYKNGKFTEGLLPE